MHLSHFQNESYIPQLFTRKFSSGEPKCPNGVVVRDWNGQFIFRMNDTYIVLLLEDCNMQVSAALTVKSIANMLIYLETVG